jgi:hypothetical protein
LANDALVEGDVDSLNNGPYTTGFFIEYYCIQGCDPFSGPSAYIAGNISSLIGVSAVPLPASIFLFGSGMLGLAAFARRKLHSS